MFTINQNLIDDFADKINEKEKKSNKVTSLSSSSTDTQYPSAKCVYDTVDIVDDKVSVVYNTVSIIDTSDSVYDADRWTEAGTMTITQTSKNKVIGGGGSGNGYVIYNGNISNLDNYDITLNLKANRTGTDVYINDNNIGTLPTSQTSILFKKRDGVVKVVYDNNQYNASAVKFMSSNAMSITRYTIDIVLYQGMIYDVINSIPSKTSDLTNDSNFLTSHQDISGKEDKSNKVTSWSNTTTDAHYPSEKLVKDSLDGKANSTHNHTVSNITDFPTTMTPSSHAHGNLQNNGQVGSTAQANKNVVTDSNGLISTEDKPTIPDVSGKEDKSNKITSNGYLIESDTHYPSSLLVLNNLDTKEDITNKITSIDSFSTDDEYPSAKCVYDEIWTNLYGSFGDLAFENNIDLEGHDLDELSDNTNLLFSGDYNDLDNKPTIPTATSDLTNDGDDGTNPFLTEHQSLTNYLQKSDVKDNLTSTDTNKPLSAKQGKELKTLIDNKPTVTVDSSWVDNSTNPVQSKLIKSALDGKANNNHSHNIFDLNPSSQYGDSAIESGVDRNGTGLGYGTDFLIYNSQDQKFYYDKNGNADYDTGNELATLNDIPNISGKEDSSNKVTSLSENSTNTQYPSAKCVYDEIKPISDELETKINIIEAINYGRKNDDEW